MSRSAEAIEAGTVNGRSSNSDIVLLEVSLGSTEYKTIDCSAEKKRSLRVRYFYGIVFLIRNLIALFIRDYGQKVVPQLHYLKACGAGENDCFQTLGVLWVSLGCFIFFFVMFLSTCYTRKLYEVGNNWHSGWWTLKFFLLIVSIAVPFFIPSDYLQLHGELARVGAGIFLLLQLVRVIEFIAWWNNYWMPDENRKQSCSLGLFMSTIFYAASILGIRLMYCLYAPRLACALNIFFITWTAILLVVMMVISLHSPVNGGLLSSGILASYIVFLCWSAIRSEPADQKCNAQKQGFVITIGAIVTATFSTGIDSQSFQFLKDEGEMEDDIPFKYGFFHLVFSLGAMYFAMLFIRWNLIQSSAKKWIIDVGWASTWVKIINEWFAATIYLWKLISSALKQPNRFMDHSEAMEHGDDLILP